MLGRLLGGLLGEVIRVEGGQDLYDRIEAVRVASVGYHRHPGAKGSAELERLLNELSLDDAVALVEGLGGLGRLRVLRSPYGHDAFLKETDRIDALLANELFGPATRIPLQASPGVSA